MKELTSYNRVAGYLNKVFDLLNEEFLKMQSSYFFIKLFPVIPYNAAFNFKLS